ncbi:dUTP diphosphatase [Spiroplasma clarkii]|uniref:dUTP diphosphatase n=1 Tax=Spiroplasma clarkii TaxID=2139 RepID=UPI002029FB5A|nr:dUTP diphosphatase [Spiroplasma clarkii]
MNLDYDFVSYQFAPVVKNTIDLYLYCYAQIAIFSKKQSTNNFKVVLDGYFSIAKCLGFTESELLTAYNEKNEVNLKRQDSNY